MSTTTKAWTYTHGPSPQNLTLTSLPLPSTPLSPTSIQIRIHAISINPVDIQLQNLPLWSLPIPPFSRPKRFGCDFAGAVLSAGPKSPFQPGARVHGFIANSWSQGSGAEVLTLDTADPSVVCAEVPEGWSWSQAASIPLVWLTARTCIAGVEAAVSAGRGCLGVLGGSSSTGMYTVRLAKARGWRVVASCGAARNGEFVKGLGADVLVDYEKQDVAAEMKREGVDAVVDCVGGTECLGVARRYVTIVGDKTSRSALGGSAVYLWNPQMVWRWLAGYLGWGVRYDCVILEKSAEYLREVGSVLRPEDVVVDSVYGFEELKEALEKLEKGRAVDGFTSIPKSITKGNNFGLIMSCLQSSDYGAVLPLHGDRRTGEQSPSYPRPKSDYRATRRITWWVFELRKTACRSTPGGSWQKTSTLPSPAHSWSISQNDRLCLAFLYERVHALRGPVPLLPLLITKSVANPDFACSEPGNTCRMTRILHALFLSLLFLKTSAVSIAQRGGIPFNKVNAQAAVAIILDNKEGQVHKIVPLIRRVFMTMPHETEPEHKIFMRGEPIINPATGIKTIAIITASEHECAGNENRYDFDKQVARDAFYTIIDKIDQGLTTDSPETVVRVGCLVYELTTGPAATVYAMLKEPAIYGKSSAEDIAKDLRCVKALEVNNACRCWFAKAVGVSEGFGLRADRDCESYTLDIVFPYSAQRAALHYPRG